VYVEIDDAFRVARDGARVALFDRQPAVGQVADDIAGTGAVTRAWPLGVRRRRWSSD
jgi:hypothetical protein